MAEAACAKAAFLGTERLKSQSHRVTNAWLIMAWPCALAALAAPAAPAALAALAALALGYFLRGFIIFILSVKALQIFTVAACQSAAHVTGMLQVRMLKFLETKAAEA